MNNIQKQLISIYSEEDQLIDQELKNCNLEQLDDNKINLLLNMNKYKFNKNIKQKLLQPLGEIKQQFDKIQSINDLMGNFQNMVNFNDLQNERLIKQTQLEDIESHLSKQHTCGRKSHQCDQICKCCDDPLTMQDILMRQNLIYDLIIVIIANTNARSKIATAIVSFNLIIQLNQIISAPDNMIVQNYVHFVLKDVSKVLQMIMLLINAVIKHINANINVNKRAFVKQALIQKLLKRGLLKMDLNSEIIQCQQKVEQQQIIHDGAHHCNEYHICDQRCPESTAFCTLKIGHEGKHQPHLHRNKEQQIFTVLETSDQEKLQIQEEGQIREYHIGESCEPETCLISCSRRSRAHYHLLECKGGKECAELLLNEFSIVAKHQTTKYKGSEQIYDEILCEAYWDHLGWEHPVESKQRSEISLCNYYCNSCKGPEQQFCIQEAWHTESSQYQDHIFICSEKHKINGLDICFVIDSTSSMNPYVEMVKTLLAKLMKSTKKHYKKNKKVLRIAIIFYKDHCDSQVVKSLDFTNYDTAIQFLVHIIASGGGDAPEAMFDGLNEASNLDWAEKSKRFVFLVPDSPPHGKPKFHNFDDSHPKGCPCGLDEYKVLNRFKELKIELFMLKLNSHLDQTIGIFKKLIPSITVLETVSKEEFINHIDLLICTELDIREITLTKQK